ncbi:unnamed protein product [Acanthoscelides obtectus]|uniref:Uncharacterized protein n=1 Tax=Acanthoscelides obtectus TaxID=200917 RepID=A0A9P0PNV6_ACAOB|nr:unnamed protein product [Acanthoscelides obtectus]CAK1661237.1 UPF0587 protein CG4646 [Acanthoscelides obtectus]
MVKITLRIQATLEGIQQLETNHPNYNFLLKLKCTSCGEITEKWQDICESLKYPGKTGRSENNYIAKCKLCGRENSIDIIPDSNAPYTNDDQGKFKPIVSFDCRGLEPVEFTPGEGWTIVAESGQIFENVDLTEKEWVEYDTKSQQSVGVFDFESGFMIVK